MAKDHEVRCRYVGKADRTPAKPAEKVPDSPDPEFARQIALAVLDGVIGRYRPTGHFSDQMAEREFDVFDVIYVIRNGTPIGDGEYSQEHLDHKYVFRGGIDGTEFDAVFALSAEHDFTKSPLIKLITGCWKTKSGKRTVSY